jgi:hypothetical protein
MLTEKATSERKWGWLPALRLILESKRGAAHYGPSSDSDQSFDRLCRNMEIHGLVHEYRAEIINMMGSGSREQIMRDLDRLRHALRNTKLMFQESEERVEEVFRGIK